MSKSKLIEQLILSRYVPNYGRTDATISIINSLERTNRTLTALETVAASSNPMVTESLHFSKVAENGKKLAAKSAAARAEIKRLSEWERERILTEIRDKSRLEPTKHAAEIRAVLREMKHLDRVKYVGDAFEKNDHATLAAVFEGNEIMTGLGDDLRDRWKTAHEQRACPSLTKDLEALDGLLVEASQTLDMIDHEVAGAYDPEFVRKAEEAAARASEADRAFEAALAEPV